MWDRQRKTPIEKEWELLLKKEAKLKCSQTKSAIEIILVYFSTLSSSSF